MLLKSRVTNEHSVVFEHRHPIVDDFGGLLGNNGLNYRANML